MVIFFAPFHLDMMSLSPKQAEEAALYIGALKRLGKAGWVRTIVADSEEGPVRILGVAGVAPKGEGVGEVFVVMAENTSRIEFVKGVRQLLDQARGHFDTIRALGEENDKRIDRWLSWLGFRQVGSELSAVVPDKRMILWELPA